MLHICYSSSMKLNGFVWSGHLPGQNGIHLHKCLLVFVSLCIFILLYLFMDLCDRGICPAWVAPMEGAPPRGVVCNWLCSSVCLYLYNLVFLFVFVFVLVRSGHLWGSDGSVEWGSPQGVVRVYHWLWRGGANKLNFVFVKNSKYWLWTCFLFYIFVWRSCFISWFVENLELRYSFECSNCAYCGV